MMGKSQKPPPLPEGHSAAVCLLLLDICNQQQVYIFSRNVPPQTVRPLLTTGSVRPLTRCAPFPCDHHSEHTLQSLTEDPTHPDCIAFTAGTLHCPSTIVTYAFPQAGAQKLPQVPVPTQLTNQHTHNTHTVSTIAS